MTRPRAQLISLETTPYYHCIARCVRRAWLYGRDSYSGKNFDHRKQWFLDRLTLLAEVFAIDVAAYSVMSNHYHLVLHVNLTRAQVWSDEDVIQRWTRLYSGPELAARYKAGSPLLEAEQDLLQRLIQRWRLRLCDISWFMRCLNEYLARRANAEDGCKGRFWEARFKSQALLDEAALLSCMAYVDLNPIRAGIASTLEESDFTSIQDRLKAVQGLRRKSTHKDSGRATRRPRLLPFSDRLSMKRQCASIPFGLKDYVDLIDWTGRMVREGKKGAIPASAPRMLKQLGLSGAEWRLLALDIQKQSITMLNGLDRVAQASKRKTISQAA